MFKEIYIKRDNTYSALTKASGARLGPCNVWPEGECAHGV